MKCWKGFFREEVNGVNGHGSHSRIAFAKSRGWNFSVSLAEGVTGRVAGYAELRGEVAYRMSGPATAANKYEVPPHGEPIVRPAVRPWVRLRTGVP